MSSEEIVKDFIENGGDVHNLEGLFESKRGTMNVLRDPRVLSHLRSLHQQGSDSESVSGAQPGLDESVESLSDKINIYNKRHSVGTFTIIQKGLGYEGPIHVSLEDQRHKVTKVLQVTNQVTVEQLLPILTQKFNISKNDKRPQVLYMIQESGEILLSKEDRPLEIVVNAEHDVRFLLKMDNVKESPSTYSFDDGETSPATNHKHLSKFFGVSSDELNAAISPSLPSNMSKWKGVPGWFKKHHGDDLSLSSNSSGSSGQHGKPVDEYHNGVKGLMLNPQSPKFRRKSETLAEPIKIRSKSKKEKHKLKQRPKSISEVLERKLTRKKKLTLEISVDVELSFDECTPGIIKVFGDEISSGATYKSVLASEQSTAEGIVKEVLDRYSLSKDHSNEYVLCDVVGKLDTKRVKGQKKILFDEGDWHMEYLRVIENNDKPLLLQGFWKPCEGCFRRFEIRRRSKCIATDHDYVTRGLNENAKRFQMHRTKASSVDFGERGRLGTQADANTNVKNEREETESSDEHSEMYHLPVPQEFPYLIYIKGSGGSGDLLCYPLNLPVTIIGKRLSNQTIHQQQNRADILLTASDIFIKHCRIMTQYLHNLSLEHFDETQVDVYLEPFPSAIVHVNGNIVEEKTQLNSGDLVGIGSSYLFIFKNPTDENVNEMSWLNESLNAHKLDSSSGEAFVRNIHPDLEPLADEYEADSARMKIIYSKGAEDDLLQHVLPMACDGEFPLVPAFVFTMCIEHTAYHHEHDDTKALLCKIANLMQNEAWVMLTLGISNCYQLKTNQLHSFQLKTKTLASSQSEKPGDVSEILSALMPELQPIIIWMSNSLELLNHLQKHIHEYIVINEEASPLSSSDSICNVDEEVLSVLEEIVMYTFQQTVYYLTKTLYISLPLILDSSPFLNDDSGDDENKKEEKALGINSILGIFQATFDLFNSLNVNNNILKQLFAYLLFFTNASLFNMLMERGPSRKSFKWSKGVQMRGNLDHIEGWIQDHGMQDIAHFLGLISTTADLLATPKLQLMQATWSSLRRDFPRLNTAQMQHILSEYQLGSSKTSPKGWYPPPEQVEDALKTDEILEGFNNHPPLVLPSSGYVLELRKQVTNTAFYSQLQALSSAFPSITIETGNPELAAPSSSTTEEKETNEKIRNRQSSLLKRQEKMDANDLTNRSVESDQSDTNNTELVESTTVKQSRQSDSYLPENRPLQVDSVANISHSRKKQDLRNGNVQTNGSLVAAQMRRMEESDKRTQVQKIRNESAETKRRLSYRNAMGQKDSEDGLSVNRDNVVKDDGKRSGEDGLSTTTKQSVDSAVQDTPRVDVTPPNWDKSIPLLEGKSSVIPPPPGWTSSMEKKNINDLANNNKLDGQGSFKESSKKPTIESSLEPETKENCTSTESDLDDVFVVDLEKDSGGIGLGLIDGMFTALRAPGIYVRTLLADGPAAEDGRLRMGDRILAVNGTSLVGADYQNAMQLIRSSGVKMRFLIARSDKNVAIKISNSSC
ncbi:ras-associating and dilute domain-containing protein-like [Antedon mediterranea]|uniref:ras-associating and dilute domain-containing protein-like n=1 Tax=Antedon mediterranea TaxID=105859 RepID=UPI003AF9B6DD